MSTVVQSKKELKQTPKTSTLINNLIKREDNLSLEVKIHKESSIALELVEKTGYRHVKASKELLKLLSKDELQILLDGKKLTKDIYYSSFKFETYLPSDEERKERTQKILQEKKDQLDSKIKK